MSFQNSIIPLNEIATSRLLMNVPGRYYEDDLYLYLKNGKRVKLSSSKTYKSGTPLRNVYALLKQAGID